MHLTYLANTYALLANVKNIKVKDEFGAKSLKNYTYSHVHILGTSLAKHPKKTKEQAGLCPAEGFWLC